LDENKVVDNTKKINRLKIDKKKLKEYVFQGIMIFLAVMLGFISDNIRENISEHNQAKEFAASMILDLKADTTELRNYIKYMTYAANNIDTLMNMLSKKDPKDVSSGKLYWYGLWGGAQFPFIPNDATFQQMKSSGSLRYFTNSSLSKEVAKYDQLCRTTIIYEEIDKNVYIEVRKARARIFEFKYNNEANMVYQENRKSFSRQRISTFIKSNPPLLTENKVIFNQYLELVRTRYIHRKLSNADSLLNHASVLIGKLKKIYQIN
jgi:hypothetical protein